MTIRMYGQNNFFSKAVRDVIEEMAEIHSFLNIDITILILSGMTLGSIVRLYGEGFRETGNLIVICSNACERMLAGTEVYRSAIFINSRASTIEFQRTLFSFERTKRSRLIVAPKHFELTTRDVKVINDYFKGTSVSTIAKKHGISPKGIYKRLEQSMFEIGVKTKQEFYYKWQLIHKIQEPNNHYDADCISSDSKVDYYSGSFFRIMSV